MKWKKFKIKTVTDAEDVIISALYDIGLEGAQIEDKVPLTALEKEQMFVDIMPEGAEDDGIAYLSFFVEEADDGRLLLPRTEALWQEITAGGMEEEAETLVDAFGAEKLYVKEETVWKGGGGTGGPPAVYGHR